jgi:hypothetical protein
MLIRDRGKIVERKRVAIERNHVWTTKASDSTKTRNPILMVDEIVGFVIFVRFVVE